MTTHELKWSSQFKVSTDPRNQRLQGDKITLPQSALEALLAAAPVVDVEHRTSRPYTSNFNPFNPYSYAAETQARGVLSDRQQQLPHPLTFRLVNSKNGKVVYAGIREFSADEGEVGLSAFLTAALGMHERKDSDASTRSKTPNADVVMSKEEKYGAMVRVHAVELQKGTYVRLRPLEAGYDVEDWKSLLEKHLRNNFTTLTNGEILTVPGARHKEFRFLVDKLVPDGDAICIVDTDLEVDIEALDEEQARETLNRKLAKANKAPGTKTGSSTGGLVVLGQEVQGQVVPGEYVDYELKEWERSADLGIRLNATDDYDLDLLVSPFSARQRSKPRLDEHMFSELNGRPSKRIKLSHTNVEVEGAESIYISVHAAPADEMGESSHQPLSYSLTVSLAGQASEDTEIGHTVEPGPDEVRCKNCHQIIPKRTLPLHEAFCYRNNIACPKCNTVFLKNSDAWKTHWHCPHDGDYGGSDASKAKHDAMFHPPAPIKCPSCDFEAFNLPILAHHRTTTCPSKEILCQFCHLVVPQQGPDDPSFSDAEVLLSGLTPHELTDGARTTECHLCSKIVRLRDMRTHLLFHDRERITRPKPVLCTNVICGRTIKAGGEARVRLEQLGLCDDCFGPLHHTAHDPEGKALRRRVERRLLQQLMAGCGKSWCHNAQWCRTGKKNSDGEDKVMTAKDAIPVVKPTLEQLAKGDVTNLSFCVDEAAQTRRATAEMVAWEGIYELGWCIKALEEEKNNLSRARDWLKDRAPRVGEVVQYSATT
ncbi:hypothetical protein R6Q59_009868 [Mikania micrantha]